MLTKAVKLLRLILSPYMTGSFGELMYYFVGIIVITKPENRGGNG
jgi:hypothetical protein